MIGAGEDLLLPAETRLLHIGPHKTGTSALQSAFHTQRRQIASQGVHYAGPNRQPMQAAHAITGRPSPYHDGQPPPRSRWRDLVREIDRASEPRVVISSEGFADADDEGIRTVVTDLGRERVHVVVTLRRLTNILPSQWQQYVQNGLVLDYDTWLDVMLNQPPGAVSPGFWQRHRHDRLVARWASAVGPGNVTVIVGDETDRDRMFRVFEMLVGLRTGTLVPEADLANRSLTRAEVEVVRAFNTAFRAERLGTQLYSKVMRFGAAEHMKRREPGPDEPRITTPEWALERGREIEREIVAGLGSAGVRIIGDLEQLAEPAPARRGKRGSGASKAAAAMTASTPVAPTADETWARIGATAAVGIVLASGLARGAPSRAGSDLAWPDGPIDTGPPPPRARVEPLELARVSTPLLGVILVRRLIGSALGRLRVGRGSA